MWKPLVLSLLYAVPFAFATPFLTSAADAHAPVHEFSKRRPLPPLPDNDPWYAAPSNLSAFENGQIIRWRPAPRPLSLDNEHSLITQAMYQIQYRTQTAKKVPMANVMTVIVPNNPKFDHLFSYIYFSDTPSPQYNPSLEMTLRTGHPVIFTKQQLGPVVSALKEGWIVAVPDDNGPQASFPSGPTMAYATIDSMRAMLQSQAITGLSPDAIITLNGYSGGGITAAWVSEIHPVYAPELKVAGIALGGLVPDFVYLSSVIRKREGYNMWGVITFVGLSHDYPELSTWLDENLIPEFAEDFWLAETLSIQKLAEKYTNITTCDYFIRGCDSWDDEVPARVLREATTNGLGAVPTIPWYLYSSAADEVSPIFMTRDLVAKYCAAGANILYEESTLPLTHAYESLVMFPGALQWLKERHAGLPIIPGCETVPVSMQSLITGWPLTFLNPVGDTLAALWDGALRPNTPDQPQRPLASDPFSFALHIVNLIRTLVFGEGVQAKK